MLISESIFKFHLASAESVIGSQTQAETGDREWQVENIINSNIAVFESKVKDTAFVKYLEAPHPTRFCIKLTKMR